MNKYVTDGFLKHVHLDYWDVRSKPSEIHKNHVSIIPFRDPTRILEALRSIENCSINLDDHRAFEHIETIKSYLVALLEEVIEVDDV